MSDKEFLTAGTQPELPKGPESGRERVVKSTRSKINKVGSGDQYAGMSEGEILEMADEYEKMAQELQEAKDELLLAKKAKDELLVQVEELRNQVKELESQARTDVLTSLPNRRYLDEELGRLWAQYTRSDRRFGESEEEKKKREERRENGAERREKTPTKEFAVIMVDIDHFKSFNDTFGHAVGDVTLTTVADIFRECQRDTDFIARYGGEEFTILLESEGLDDKTLLGIAERYRERVQSEAQKRVKTKTQDVKGKNGEEIPEIHISLGVARSTQLEGKELIAENVTKLADNALYVSKNTGRNRTTLYGQPNYEAPEKK